MTDPRPPRRPSAGGGPPRHKSDLSEPRRLLLEVFQELNFGRVQGLVVRGGEPVLDPRPRVVQEVKFQADNEPRPERTSPDFQLKAQQVELMALLDRVQDGIIDWIECRHGLPFRAAVPEPVRRPPD
jgi:hypothetical protein